MADQKLLLVNKAYWPHLGGVETVVRQLAAGMSERGWRVTVLCMGDDPGEGQDGPVQVVRVRTRIKAGSAPLSPEFVRVLGRLAASNDLVHFHYPNPMAEMAWLMLGRTAAGRVPALCTYHSDPMKPRWLLPAYSVLTKAFLRSMRSVVATSPSYCGSSPFLSSLAGGGKLRVIPLGVDVRRFMSPDSEGAAWLEHRLPFRHAGGRLRLLFIGRLVYYKGVEVLLEALSGLPQAEALVVGDGPLAGMVDALAAGRLRGRLVRMSPVPDGDYPALFAWADAFVLPSIARTEAFGIVLAEAMAAGLPAISTELATGTSWVNENGVTGFVVQPGNVPALADAIRQMCHVGAEHREQMGSMARARAWGLFDQGEMLEAYASLYGEVKTGKGDGPR
jgi:rhamnosyl/mannosyltransferase